jgi:hypothetical protein
MNSKGYHGHLSTPRPMSAPHSPPSSHYNRFNNAPQDILHDAIAALETNRSPKRFTTKSFHVLEKAQTYLRLSQSRNYPRDSIQHFSACFPDAKERVSILLEIVESQRNYVNFLKMIRDFYYLPMVHNIDTHRKSNFDRPGLPQEECALMFPKTFTQILASDEILLHKLDERLKIYTREGKLVDTIDR